MTVTANHNLTLSRWHSVAERIRAAATQKQREALACLDTTRLTTAPTDQQKEALRQRGTRALNDLNEARRALRVVGEIRAALAGKNAEIGVSGLLALAEAKRQEARLLGEALGIDLLTKVGLDEVGAALEKGAQAKDHVGLLSRGSSGVSVNVVPIDALSSLRAEKNALDAEVAALTDRVNDLNKQKLALPLPVDLARAVGLAVEG